MRRRACAVLVAVLIARTQQTWQIRAAVVLVEIESHAALVVFDGAVEIRGIVIVPVELLEAAAKQTFALRSASAHSDQLFKSRNRFCRLAALRDRQVSLFAHDGRRLHHRRQSIDEADDRGESDRVADEKEQLENDSGGLRLFE